MNSEKNSELFELAVSLEQIKETFKERLYQLGYASKPNEYIADISFGALHEQHIPVHFWVEKSQSKDEEVLTTEYNGKA